TRVVVHGYQGGGAMAMVLASRNRDWIRAAAVVDSLPTQKLPENEPPHRLALFVALAKKGSTAATREKAVDVLRDAKYPLTLNDLGEEPRPLSAEERAELVRWVDTLDRL